MDYFHTENTYQEELKDLHRPCHEKRKKKKKRKRRRRKYRDEKAYFKAPK